MNVPKPLIASCWLVFACSPGGNNTLPLPSGFDVSSDASSDLSVTADTGVDTGVDASADILSDALDASSDATPEVAETEVQVDVPAPLAPGFAGAPVAWAVPDLRFGSVAASVAQNVDSWTTTDVNGDGYPDLLWTGTYSSSSGVVAHNDGGANWRVYWGDGIGFAPTPTAWAVPDARFGSLGGNALQSGDEWATVDMDGDGRPDLVWSGTYSSSTGLSAHNDVGHNWRVYLNDGNGFALSPTPWAVPDARFGGVAGSLQSGPDQWATLDMDGDKRPDLVWSGNNAGAHNDGGPNWRVYLGGSGGFAPSPTVWSVPDGRFGGVAGNLQLGPDEWATLDMDGDERPDLVWTGTYSTPSGSIAHNDGGANWRVYLSGSGGFASSPTPWAVPDTRFGSLARSAQQGGDGWVTLDMDGDGSPDLVWSGTYSPPNGTRAHSDQGANWRVYLGGGGGFATSPTPWVVPDERFGSVAVGAQQGSDAWATLDMNGDARPDLVWTGTYSTPTGLTAHNDGGANWRVYVNGL